MQYVKNKREFSNSNGQTDACSGFDCMKVHWRFHFMGLKFLDKVIKKKNIRSYIIGGDFNFNTSTKVPNLPGNVHGDRFL
jgi:hypothetical protein